MKVAYLDCFSGISGDMLLGALADAGVDMREIEETLRRLPVRGYRLDVTTCRKGGVMATRVKVVIDEEQPARRLADIVGLLEAGNLPPNVLEQAKRIFLHLARAEAKIHGMNIDEVHLHEAGAVDALVEVVAALLGFDLLGVKRIVASPLPCPRGFVEVAHGILPVPAPAVLELLKGAPVYGVESDKELVTPTGAAILAGIATEFGPIPPMAIEKVAYGAGEHDLAIPNVLRIILGQDTRLVPARERDLDEDRMAFSAVAVIETTIDDMNPEFYPYLADRLRQGGAQEVFWTPVHMKKNRPGVLVSVLLPPDRLVEVAKILLSESTTLGLRWRIENRWCLESSAIQVQVNGKNVRVKCICTRGTKSFYAVPEYEDCRTVAETTGLPLKEVYALAQSEAIRVLRLVGTADLSMT